MSDNRVPVRMPGALALVLGGLAVIAGSPSRDPAANPARAVDSKAAYLSAVELAKWIRDRKPNLRIVDTRDSADFDQYHIPTAEQLDLEQLRTVAFSPGEIVVLYSGEGASASREWVSLRDRGVTQVYVLRGGVAEWINEVVNPEFPRNATATEQAEIDSVSALSRYFDGSPRIVDSVRTKTHDEAPSWTRTVEKIRGRGC